MHLSLGLVLEELKKHVERLRLLTELGDDGARAADDLGGLALLVDLAKAAPLTELLAGVDHDEVDAALLAERADELGVLRIVAVLREAAQLGGVLVEGLGAPGKQRGVVMSGRPGATGPQRVHIPESM